MKPSGVTHMGWMPALTMTCPAFLAQARNWVPFTTISPMLGHTFRMRNPQGLLGSIHGPSRWFSRYASFR